MQLCWNHLTHQNVPLVWFCFKADDIFETVSDRELRQIFEGQNRIHVEIKQLNRQLDMILDEQRRYVSAVTEEISKRGSNVPSHQGQVYCWYMLHGSQFCILTLSFSLTVLFSVSFLFKLQASQLELDNIVKTQEEVLRQVGEMK